MSSPPTLSQPQETPESQKTISDSPVPSPDNTSQSHDSGEQHNGHPPPSPRPMRKYTRPQLVSLSGSPLVKPPPNMPELKVWFGSENESPQKKDDPPTSSTARERRFRRDAEDGDVPARPTFRTALTQPSQMGNFKHQSLRPSDRDRDRDRDRDGEKEREREIREKEGHERLRHLSDKFDRDRLALPLAARKDRDVAPHLNANSSRTPQPLSSNAASRRADTREATKKKVGEASEDWRRGAEPPRPGREDRAENGRERTRDSSRPKRDVSTSRRDRDELREKAPRGDRERDDHRRDKDVDGEEDPRRWRDDGKREERIATSRRERGRDKPNNDHSWEGTTDKRWATSDDRGYKRSSARDRKPGHSDDVKDKDERREREKEKEPAWMDTYVPNESTPGILGGHNSTGEPDDIQAWKKGLKEKESKEKEASLPPKLTQVEKSAPPPTLPEKSEGVMNEIQLFKLLMKQSEEKKKTDSDEAVPKNDHVLHQLVKQDNTIISAQQGRERTLEDSLGESFTPGANSEGIRPQAQSTPSAAAVSTDLPLFPPGLKDHILPGKLPTEPSQAFPQGRGLTNLGAPQDLLQPAASKPVGDSISTSFQPPPGSRLLAFARPPVKGSGSGNPTNTLQSLNGGLTSIMPDSSQGFAKNESSRPQPGFSPFDDQTRQHYGFDEPREVTIPHNLNALSRASMDQNFNSNVNAQIETNYNGPAAKGSRFAKFFDGKGREGLPSSGKPQLPGGFTSPSPNHIQRQDHTSMVQGNPGDQRAMDELFAMLNNSSQRGNIGPHSNPLVNNNGAFGSPGPSLHALQQQHLLSQTQQHHNSRLEPLYDSRSDDRSFVPDGMVPGLRPIPPPPPRGRDGHFVEHVDDPMHYNFQRMLPPHNQQPQPRNLEPLYPGPAPLYAQQGRPNAGLNLQTLQQPQYRGGPSPNSNQGVPISNGPQQRLPPGLANLGGRPPHEPTQFLGMPNLPSTVPHNPLHGNAQLQAQQLPFNNFNATNNIGFNGLQVRGPVPGPHLHNTGAPQHPLGNNGHPSMDPRLSNHHHLMGLGGSGVGGNRINGGFPQQGPAPQPHLAMRPQQQQQQQNHLPPHMLPHLMPPHLQQQQGHPGSNNQSHDLMALLLGGPHRE